MDHPMSAEQEILQDNGYNASDPEQVNKARKKSARARKEELDFIVAIMSNKAGRRWLFNLITTCNPFGNPVIPGDTHLTYHNIGAQNIGKKLLQDINEGAPKEYILMMQESRE